MMVFIDAKYQLFRNRGRTILLVCISALLCSCVAIYIGNIFTTQQALKELAVATPVIVRIVNADGSSHNDLDIDPARADRLLEMGLRDVQITCSCSGAYSSPFKGMDPFFGGDCTVFGVNCPEAGGLEDLEGRDMDFLSGSEALCVLDESFAEENGIKVGDTISIELHRAIYGGTHFQKLSDDVRLKVVVLCSSGEGTGATMYVPLDWIRAFCQETGRTFMYNSYCGTMTDPLNINEFKAKLREAHFVQPFAEMLRNPFLGDAVSVEDEMFFKTAQRLEENLRMFRKYLPVFCAAVTALVTLVIFLILRGARRDMAVAISLGRQKTLIALSHLLSLLCAQLTGCFIAWPVMVLAGLGWSAAVIALSFLGCALTGNLLGLAMVMRFDALQMLLTEK